MAVAGSSERFGYDALGRLATTSNALGTFSYDHLGAVRFSDPWRRTPVPLEPHTGSLDDSRCGWRAAEVTPQDLAGSHRGDGSGLAA